MITIVADARQHIDPFAGLTNAIAELVADKVEERLKPLIIQAQTSTLFEQSGIELMKAYTAEEVAAMLGTKRKESIYEIPQDELPRVRRIGKHFGYLGINVLRYMHRMPPIDMEAALRGYHDRLMQERPNVIPLHPHKEEKTRVI